MLALRKNKGLSVAPESALTLRTAEGAPLYTFPGEVVNSMRYMATTLTYKGDLPARIAMIAALRQEGVTYTTLALATTLAYDSPAHICVVDCNWWSPGLRTQPLPENEIGDSKSRKSRPKKQRDELATTTISPEDSAAQTFDSNGLAAVLLGNATINDVLIPTALPNLSLLPAGTLAQAHRPAIARSHALKATIEQLSRHFDHLLLDIPAILSTSDAIALASLGIACCLVIRQGITPVSHIQRALDDVKHLPMLGVVLNQAQMNMPRWLRSFIPQE